MGNVGTDDLGGHRKSFVLHRTHASCAIMLVLSASGPASVLSQETIRTFSLRGLAKPIEESAGATAMGDADHREPIDGLMISSSSIGSISGGVIGPDLIVGVLPSMGSWGTDRDISVFSAGTTACNKGDQQLFWVAHTSEHPVIAQNLYRLKNNRFEQIGMSWVKHEFFALQMNSCDLGCQPPGTGTRLGVGCSNPDGAALNAAQSLLGPRSQIDGHTGFSPIRRPARRSRASLIVDSRCTMTISIPP